MGTLYHGNKLLPVMICNHCRTSTAENSEAHNTHMPIHPSFEPRG